MNSIAFYFRFTESRNLIIVNRVRLVRKKFRFSISLESRMMELQNPITVNLVFLVGRGRISDSIWSRDRRSIYVAP